MTDAPQKFFPRPTPGTAVYWEGCRNQQLLIQRCRQCGSYQFYPRIICTACDSADVEWVRSSGRGEVLTYTVITRAVSKAYAEDAPYVIALIRLAEGPKMMSNVVECDPESVQVGMAVEVVFDQWSEEITIPKFRPTLAAD